MRPIAIQVRWFARSVTGVAATQQCSMLLVVTACMRQTFVTLFDREIEFAHTGVDTPVALGTLGALMRAANSEG